MRELKLILSSAHVTVILAQCNNSSVERLDVILRDFVNKKHLQAMNTKYAHQRHTTSASRDECAECQTPSTAGIWTKRKRPIRMNVNCKETLW